MNLNSMNNVVNLRVPHHQSFIFFPSLETKMNLIERSYQVQDQKFFS